MLQLEGRDHQTESKSRTGDMHFKYNDIDFLREKGCTYTYNAKNKHEKIDLQYQYFTEQIIRQEILVEIKQDFFVITYVKSL